MQTMTRGALFVEQLHTSILKQVATCSVL